MSKISEIYYDNYSDIAKKEVCKLIGKHLDSLNFKNSFSHVKEEPTLTNFYYWLELELK